MVSCLQCVVVIVQIDLKADVETVVIGQRFLRFVWSVKRICLLAAAGDTAHRKINEKHDTGFGWIGGKTHPTPTSTCAVVGFFSSFRSPLEGAAEKLEHPHVKMPGANRWWIIFPSTVQQSTPSAVLSIPFSVFFCFFHPTRYSPLLTRARGLCSLTSLGQSGVLSIVSWLLVEPGRVLAKKVKGKMRKSKKRERMGNKRTVVTTSSTLFQNGHTPCHWLSASTNSWWGTRRLGILSPGDSYGTRPMGFSPFASPWLNLSI